MNFTLLDARTSPSETIEQASHANTRYKAILFDCDGVLLDSEEMGCGAIAQSLSEAGHLMTTHEARAIFSGNGPSTSLAWMVDHGLDAEEIFRKSDEILFQMFESSIPQISDILPVLQDYPLKKAVCSNSSVRRLELSIARTSLAPYFDGHIYSGEQVENSKPAPDLALFACEKLGVQPHEAIFIDDNIQGVLCAKQAGCLAIGFIGPSDDRVGHEENLRKAGADYVIYGMEEFHSLLSKLTDNNLEAIA